MPGDIENPKTSSDDVAKKMEAANNFRQQLLDDLVSVNSLFTVAVFVGLSFTSGNQHSLENKRECDPDLSLAKKLLVYEVLSFAFFLFSSLVAKTLKVQINLEKFNIYREVDRNWASFMIIVTEGMLNLSILGTMLGCIFLTLSMVVVVEIRIGRLSCRSEDALTTVTALVFIVSLSLLVYLVFMIRAYRRLIEFRFPKDKA